MDLRKPTTTNELQDIIVMVQYHHYMWLIKLQIMVPLLYKSRRLRARRILWNYDIKSSLKISGEWYM